MSFEIAFSDSKRQPALHCLGQAICNMMIFARSVCAIYTYIHTHLGTPFTSKNIPVWCINSEQRHAVIPNGIQCNNGTCTAILLFLKCKTPR